MKRLTSQVKAENVATDGAADGEGSRRRLNAMRARLVSLLVGAGNPRVFLVFMLSATVIVAARLAAPYEVAKDQGIQLEAAQRLVDGYGLTSTYFAAPLPEDISLYPEPRFLTWWPPGLSLLVAGFLIVGLPLGWALKILGALTTLVGWLGWAALGSRALAEPIAIRGWRIPLHYLIAAMMPILWTPLWNGTDIYLWAGVPVIVLLTLKYGEPGRPYRGLVLAGLIFGALYPMRYASLFMGGAVFLILLHLNYSRWKQFALRVLVFGISAAPVILATVIYVKTHSHHASSLPALVDFESALPNLGNNFIHIFRRLLVLSNLAFGSPLIDRAFRYVDSDLLKSLAGLVSLVVLFALPALLLRYRVRRGKGDGGALALSLSLVPLALVLFLIAARLISREDLFGVRRYYLPIAFMSVLVYYLILTRTRMARVVKAGCALVILLFLAFYPVAMAVSAMLPERRSEVVTAVLGYTPTGDPRYASTSLDVGYPSGEIYSMKENSRRKLGELFMENPDARFLVGNYAYYIWEYEGFCKPGETETLFRTLPPRHYWSNAYTSRALRIFFVVDIGTPLDFIPESMRNEVFVDTEEKTQIVRVDFPEGYRFAKAK